MKPTGQQHGKPWLARTHWLINFRSCVVVVWWADDYAVIEMDAQDMGIDRVREFERMCQFKPLGKGCHVFIINEAHGLSSKVVSRLQTVLEQSHVQRNSTWIFTTTFQGARERRMSL